MNDKIKELADQAKKYALDAMIKITDKEQALKVYSETYDTKYAELIVRECTKVIVHGGYWSGGPLGPKRQCTPPEIAQMIKEHFGVAEREE